MFLKFGKILRKAPVSEFLLKNKRRERRFPENFAKLEKTAFSYSTPMTASENSLHKIYFALSLKWTPTNETFRFWVGISYIVAQIHDHYERNHRTCKDTSAKRFRLF